MTRETTPAFVVVHADESCLGNQRSGPQPGGAGALIECRTPGGSIERRDWYAHAAGTTNNRMALHGAIAVLGHLVGSAGSTPDVHYFSDSKYLVEGITNWVHGWKARGWKRRTGPVENVEMWQRLDELTDGRGIHFHWVRGHSGHPKNEYADYLAVRAAETQTSSDGLMPSGFLTWLHGPKQSPHIAAHDPNQHFRSLETQHAE